MKAKVLAQVADLLENHDQPSRNRNFQDFNSPRGQNVLRLYRLYLSLLLELEDAAARPEVLISASDEAGGLMLELKDPKVSYRRSCLVPKELAETFHQKIKGVGPVQPP